MTTSIPVQHCGFSAIHSCIRESHPMGKRPCASRWPCIENFAIRRGAPIWQGVLNDLARALMAQGKPAEAETLIREAWRIKVRTFGNDNVNTRESLKDLID